EVDLGRVALEAVTHIEAEQRQDDVVEIDAQAGADVVADVAGAELVGQVVARARKVKTDVAGVVETEGAERQEPPLEQRDRVLGAGRGADVAAELVDIVAAQIAHAAEREVLVQRQVAADVEVAAQLELVLVEQAPAVIRAQHQELVVV